MDRGSGSGAPPTHDDILRAPLLSEPQEAVHGSYGYPGSAASTTSQATSDTRVGRSESRKSGASESARRSRSRKLKPVTSRARMGKESPSPVVRGRPPLSVSMQQLGGRSQPASPRWQQQLSPRAGIAGGSPSPMSVNRANGSRAGMYSEVDETSSSISQDKSMQAMERAAVEQSPSAQSPRTPSRKPYRPSKNDPMRHRMKFYTSLRNMQGTAPGGFAEDMEYLVPPAQVLPPNLFVYSEEGQEQSRFSTITSIVNTMMGTAIVAIPMYYAEAGLLLGLVMTVVIGGISAYTALLVVSQAEASQTQEYSGLARYYLGFPVQITSWVMGILIIMGAVIVYHILMQESLYSIVLSIAVAASGGHEPQMWTHYGRIISAGVVWLLWPLANLQDLSVLVKFNSVGFLFLVYTVTFILVNGFIGISFGDFEVVSHLPAGASEFNVETGNMQVVLWGRQTFVPLAGTLMLSTFIHNAIQPICKNAPKATRSYDVFYGYLIASVLYMFIGVLGYFGFAALKPGKGVNLALQSNFLDMFGSTFTKGLDIYAFTARMSLFFQLVTVFPILLMIVRTQFFGYLMQTTWPGWVYVASLNFAIMALSFTLAAMNMDVGTVVRITGALGGLVLIYLVPLGADLVKTAREGGGSSPWWKWCTNVGLILGAAGLLALQFVPALTG